MAQLENIEAIERRLWGSADQLRSNSNYASNEYFMPVMGLIFLRHAYSRYLMVKNEIVATLPTRAGKTRALTKEDFSSKSAIFLQPEAQFDYLVNLPDSEDRAQAIIHAMESIEQDYETLKGVLPKTEYQDLDNTVLGNLLRTFNDPALHSASGDIFGRIYEYFLTEFANQSAHDGGEFFTPVSLVQMIVNLIEPDHGTVTDPACGSGGMFVQSAHFIEKLHKNPQSVATFYGQEKNPTTIRLAKMNLAVHGLEGNIAKGITYYEDHNELLHKADFVMANPPFNVDDVDAEKIKNDPRLPFGLPGVNKKGAVSNGNYLWIQYFYSYLNDQGRAGFVMSSQASSAGRDEAKVRQKLVESGHVDVMMAIRSNFFYTRTVPCELWFLNKAKPKHLQDKVLMLDARHVFRKVTRKIYDFSPEQMEKLTAIVWLYRGEEKRYADFIKTLAATVSKQEAVLRKELDALLKKMTHHFDAPDAKEYAELLKKAKQHYGDKHYKKAFDIACKAGGKAKPSAGWVGNYPDWDYPEILRLIARADAALHAFLPKQHQLEWLQERFPEGKLRDVEGLVKLVTIEEIKANDWSLTPGRYVGVTAEIDEEGFDFDDAMSAIHTELRELNKQAIDLVKKIDVNFEDLAA